MPETQEQSQSAGDLVEEVRRRRTFAIISHPDAGKTTLTEKLLLYGGRVQLAGAVKARRQQAHAISDWMEMEKTRGISITSTVLSFDYKGYRLNLLDTPGHQDFSEDTYRTLLAADCAVMILDAAKGIEPQTLKLFHVCKLRRIPIFTFINKMDRPSLDPLDLLDEIERVLGLRPVPMNWPLGNGRTFRGVYDRSTGEVHLFERAQHGQARAAVQLVSPDSPALAELTDADTFKEFNEGLELLQAGEGFQAEGFRSGRITPVYFGSALTNFGVELFLEQFLEMAPAPGPRLTDAETVEPAEDRFSGFVFKIQADMNPRHRDRVAFLRICSGRFQRGMTVTCSRTGEEVRLSYAQQLFAQSRQIVEEAFPGDVVGMVNPGSVILGDTLVENGSFRFEPIPQFAPEHFARVTISDPSRRKHFRKAMDQLGLEGAVQIFWFPDVATRDPVLGAVGMLQFEVVKYRLENDYRVDINYEHLPYKLVRWLEGSPEAVGNFQASRGSRQAEDNWGRAVALFPGQWDLDYALQKNPGLVFREISQIGL